MPLLMESPPKDFGLDEICQICERPRKEHTIEEIKECSRKLKGI